MMKLQDIPNFDDLRALTDKGKAEIYLVGGFLRDYALGIPKLDFDFAMKGPALRFAQKFSKKIHGAYVLLDKERECARVVKRTPSGTATFDFTGFRAKTIRGDIAARDFTVNTLYVDVARSNPQKDIDELIRDGAGAKKDLKAKRVRMTNDKVFRDDPLRMMRAFTLFATRGFTIERETLGWIKTDRFLIRQVSVERARDELFKILQSDRAYETLTRMDKIGLLEEVLPQIHVMYNCEQGGYHHLDVWNHTLEAVKQFDAIVKATRADEDIAPYLDAPLAGERDRKSLIKLALILHDVGKPETKEVKDDGHFHFYGHEHAGKETAHHVARQLKLSTRERHKLEDMVEMHLRPGYLSNVKVPTRRSVFRFLRDAKEEAVSILLLSLADQRATRGPKTSEEDQKHHEEICLGLVKSYFEKQKEQPFVPLINGNDVMKKLKLTPSPLIGTILKAVEEAQALGQVKTKDEALALAAATARKVTDAQG